MSHYPADEQVESHELRSGQFWAVRLEVWVVPDGVTDFPGLQRVVRVTRTVLQKSTKQTKVGVAFAVSNLSVSAAEFLLLDRSRWGVENKSHHARDTIFAEDACRSRKAARVLAVFRNAVNGLFRQLDGSVLRCVRRFAVHPVELLKLIK